MKMAPVMTDQIMDHLLIDRVVLLVLIIIDRAAVQVLTIDQVQVKIITIIDRVVLTITDPRILVPVRTIDQAAVPVTDQVLVITMVTILILIDRVLLPRATDHRAVPRVTGQVLAVQGQITDRLVRVLLSPVTGQVEAVQGQTIDPREVLPLLATGQVLAAEAQGLTLITVQVEVLARATDPVRVVRAVVQA